MQNILPFLTTVVSIFWRTLAIFSETKINRTNFRLQKFFGFIKRVDKGEITTVKDLEI